jgi:hypothetical protein
LVLCTHSCRRGKQGNKPIPWPALNRPAPPQGKGKGKGKGKGVRPTVWPAARPAGPTRYCYRCGEPGHIARWCPMRAQSVNNKRPRPEATEAPAPPAAPGRIITSTSTMPNPRIHRTRSHRDPPVPPTAL